MTAPHWRPAYIGIGSNLDSPEDQVASAIAAMRNIPQTILALRSSLYRSAPLGPADQPDFINAVVVLLTQLDPLELLAELKAVEASHGRDRTGERWGPRTLDLDMLAYAGLSMASDELTLPHPGIAERNFVLLPWNEVAPHFRVPGLSTVAQLAKQVSAHEPRIEKIT